MRTRNRKLNNDLGFPDKVDRYAESHYQLSRDLGGDSWDMDALTRRQERLAKRAVHIWRIDF